MFESFQSFRSAATDQVRQFDASPSRHLDVMHVEVAEGGGGEPDDQPIDTIFANKQVGSAS
jgi:hypothetical protein